MVAWSQTDIARAQRASLEPETAARIAHWSSWNEFAPLVHKLRLALKELHTFAGMSWNDARQAAEIVSDLTTGSGAAAELIYQCASDAGVGMDLDVQRWDDRERVALALNEVAAAWAKISDAR
jgi:hypothetical protein